MSKAKGANPFAKVGQTAKGQLDRDRTREISADRPKDIGVVSLLDIKGRLSIDKRPLTLPYVIELAESIAMWGMIQAPAVDSKHRLVAGGHRRAALLALSYIAEPDRYREAWLALWPGSSPETLESALALLRTEESDSPMLPRVRAWHEKHQGKVPVTILPFDSADESDRAKLLEIIENEKRKPFTRDEIRLVADDLKQSGYRNVPGRPKAGQQSLKKALSLIFGISYATVRRHLAPDPQEDKPTKPASKAKDARDAIKAIDKFLAAMEVPAEISVQLKSLREKLVAVAKE